jgi:hypothetical protein
MIRIFFPIKGGPDSEPRSWMLRDREVFKWAEALPKLENGDDPFILDPDDSEYLIFQRQEDAVLFKLKFGV